MVVRVVKASVRTFVVLALLAVLGAVFASVAHAQAGEQAHCEEYGAHVYSMPIYAPEDMGVPVGVFCGVDVNSATLEELKLVKGIGDTLGERIILQRDEHAPFVSPLVESLQTVKGIKLAKARAFTTPATRKGSADAFALIVR